jgi:hypothetical protein
MAHVYKALGATTPFDRNHWVVLRFRKAKSREHMDRVRLPEQFAGGYSLRMYHATGQIPDPPRDDLPVTTFVVSYDELIHVLATPQQVWIERNGCWQLIQF